MPEQRTHKQVGTVLPADPRQGQRKLRAVAEALRTVVSEGNCEGHGDFSLAAQQEQVDRGEADSYVSGEFLAEDGRIR